MTLRASTPPPETAATPVPDGDALLAALLERLPNAVVVFDAEDRLLLWNDAYLRFFPDEARIVAAGVPYVDTLRIYFMANLPRSELPELERHLAAGLKRHRDLADGGPFVFQPADGRWLKVEAHRLPDGRLLKMWTDVTAEHALATHAPGPLDAATAVDVGFARFDAAARLITANRGLEVLLPDCVDLFRAGVPYRALLEKVAVSMLDEAGCRLLLPLAGRVDPVRQPVLHPLVLSRADGRWLHLEERPTADGGFVSSWVDVTAQVRSEMELERTRNLLADAVESMPEGFALFDARGSLVRCNERYRALMATDGAEGVTIREILGSGVQTGHFAAAAAMGEAEREGWIDAQIRRHRTHGLPVELEIAGGRWIRLSDRATESGGVVAVVTEITEAKRREDEAAARSRAELARKNAILEATLENVAQGICLFDADGRIVAYNRRLLEMMRIPAWFADTNPGLEDVVRFQVENGIPATPPGFEGPERREELVRFFLERFHQQKEEATHLQPMSDGRCLEIQVSPTPDGGHVRTYTDITGRRRAEQELRAAKERAEQALAELRNAQQSLIQSEKMAALGSLVAGVAHEINTPVGLTLTTASLLADETGALARRFEEATLRKSELQRFITLVGETSQRILANTYRAAELIQSFKQVAVDQTTDDRRAFDLGQYIHEVLLSFGPRLKRTGIEVSVDAPEGLVVDGYPGPVAQVMTNLVMNSLIHAFEPGTPGRIRIVVEELPGGEVGLTYTDDGKGIPADVLPRIFDPFFTTNRGGGGTGLGLNIVYNIVTGTMRGVITAESEPGRGTTFRLRFPKCL